MTVFGMHAARRPLDPASLVGRYTLYDDGWRCRLDLAWDGAGLGASFYSYDRTPGSFPATIELDQEHGTCTLIVDDFNELPSQRYDGLVWTSPHIGIAGTTDWQGQLFGFFAAPRPPLPIGADALSPPTIGDVRGSFVLHSEAGSCVLHITETDDATGRGLVREPSGVTAGLTISADQDDPRRFMVVVDGSTATMTMWMFSRRHDALAGWISREGRRTGCYLVRVADDDHLIKEA